MAFDRRRGRRGLVQTLLISFIFGAFSTTFVINQSSAAPLYDGDYFSFCVLGPIGAFCGMLALGCAHELTQFFAARCAGFYIRGLFIGGGRTLAKFRFKGVPCIVSESLVGGLVFYLVTSRQHARLKMFFVIAAAIAASVALTAILFWLAVTAFPTSPSPVILRRLYAFLLGMTGVALICLPGILIPFSYTYHGTRVQSDTMRLLTLWRKTDAEIERQILAVKNLTTDEIDPMTFSLEEAEANVEADPESAIALRTAIMYLRPYFDPKLPGYYRRLIAAAATPGERLRSIDEFLTYCLEGDSVAANAAEMEALSTELLASDPNNPSLRGTRGSILIDLGRREEGVAMLADILARSDDPVNQCYSSIFMALAAKSAGDLKTASEYANHARKTDGECLALKRIADLLDPTSRPPSSPSVANT